MNDPVVSRIDIYPVKSLDGISLQEAQIAEGGCLDHDREYALFDSSGNFINGKANPLVHLLRSKVDFESEMISLRHQQDNTWKHFHLQKEKAAMESWLSDFFSEPVVMHQNKTGRFLDIPDIAGLTVLSAASLQSVSEWYQMDLSEIRKRFRATIEMKNVLPFWEDHLFSTEGKGVEFSIGDVKVIGLTPRERCVVPTRNAKTGEVTHAFPKIFSRHRSKNLPADSLLESYGHYYYLTVNCYVPATETGKWIRTGDEIKITGEKKFYDK
jgi:uncharacterized protein YcbX